MKIRTIKIESIEGFKIGNAQDASAGTGCTAIICEKGATGGVDVRGSSPATRETDLLKSENSVDTVHAVVLSGGSAFGLEAASGVMRRLKERGVGIKFDGLTIPIVCGASLFDLKIGDSDAFPDTEMGMEAADNAFAGLFDTGNRGAGTGASVGKFEGMSRAMKSGLGAFACGDGYIQLGAVVAVNALGDIYNGAGNIIAGLRSEDGRSIYGTIKTLKNHVHEFSDLDMDEMHPVTDRSTYSSSKVERTRALDEIRNAIRHAFEKSSQAEGYDATKDTREIDKIADIPEIQEIDPAVMEQIDSSEIEDIYIAMTSEYSEPASEAAPEVQPEAEAEAFEEPEAEVVEIIQSEPEPEAEVLEEPEAEVFEEVQIEAQSETEPEAIEEPEPEPDVFEEVQPEPVVNEEVQPEPEPEVFEEDEAEALEEAETEDIEEEEPHGPKLDPEDMGYDITFNTTIGCLITNAKLTKPECNRLASILHDAYARAIKPVHSSVDGDAIFVLSSGVQEVNFDAFAALATDVMQYAIINAAESSKSAYGLPSASDMK